MTDQQPRYRPGDGATISAAAAIVYARRIRLFLTKSGRWINHPDAEKVKELVCQVAEWASMLYMARYLGFMERLRLDTVLDDLLRMIPEAFTEPITEGEANDCHVVL
jgi:hypothetical protein